MEHETELDDLEIYSNRNRIKFSSGKLRVKQLGTNDKHFCKMLRAHQLDMNEEEIDLNVFYGHR